MVQESLNMETAELKSKSIKELRQLAQSTAPEAGRDPWVGLTIRFFSIYITKYLVRTPITPNQVTFVSVLVFLGGVGLFAFNTLGLDLLGVFLVYLSIVLDGCDGEVARLKFPKSKLGGIYTEPFSHDVQYGLMFVPISYGAYLATGSVTVLFAGWAACLGKLLYRCMSVRMGQVVFWRQVEKDGYVVKEDAHRVAFVRDVPWYHRAYRFVNRNFLSSVGFVIPLTVFALLRHMDWFVYLFAAYFCLIAVMTFVQQAKQMSGYTRESLAKK